MERKLVLPIQEIKKKAKENAAQNTLANGKNPLLNDEDSPLRSDPQEKVQQPFIVTRQLSRNSSLSSSFDDLPSAVQDVLRAADHSQQDSYSSVATRLCNRKTNEDRFALISPETSDEGNSAFYGVYDGHSNYFVSEYLEKHLHKNIYSAIGTTATEKTISALYIPAIKKACLEANNLIVTKLEELNIPGGSTAAMVMVFEDELVAATVGDSKVFAIQRHAEKGFVARDLTEEHRLTNESECKRLADIGAHLVQREKGKRTLLEGSFALTRSFGDFNYKNFITAEPSFASRKLEPEDIFLLLCTDGYWEMLGEKPEEQLAMAINKLYGKPANLAESLVEDAIKQNEAVSKDNMTVVIVEVRNVVKCIKENKRSSHHFPLDVKSASFIPESAKEEQKDGLPGEFAFKKLNVSSKNIPLVKEKTPKSFGFLGS